MPYPTAFRLNLFYSRVIDCKNTKNRENYPFFLDFLGPGSASGGAWHKKLAIFCVKNHRPMPQPAGFCLNRSNSRVMGGLKNFPNKNSPFLHIFTHFDLVYLVHDYAK
jgi:hypothetical protein